MGDNLILFNLLTFVKVMSTLLREHGVVWNPPFFLLLFFYNVLRKSEVYPDWPLSVGLSRWKCLKDKVCSIALPMLLISLALWEKHCSTFN